VLFPGDSLSKTNIWAFLVFLLRNLQPAHKLEAFLHSLLFPHCLLDLMKMKYSLFYASKLYNFTKKSYVDNIEKSNIKLKLNHVLIKLIIMSTKSVNPSHSFEFPSPPPMMAFFLSVLFFSLVSAPFLLIILPFSNILVI